MYLCICEGVTEQEFREDTRLAVAQGCDAIKFDTAGRCCKCIPRIKEIFNEEKQKQERDSSTRTG